MVTDDSSFNAITLAGIIGALVAMGFYAFPWMIPMFHDMPEGTTLPYYGILVAVEMTHFARRVRETPTESIFDEP